LPLRSTLDRYLHYVTRYDAHLASLRWEERARGELELKIDAMIEAESSLSNYAWLQAAMEQLFLARRVLAYSYLFAFYMFGGAMFPGELAPGRCAVTQALFEDKQGQLEGEVERLAKLVEATPAADIPALRLPIINLATTINTRIVKLYEVIENDIAGQLAAASLHVAPYRGQRTPGGGELFRHAAPSPAAGPSSHSRQPSAEIVDLTAGQSDGSPPDGKGKARAGSKRLRKL
jgi:ariadne-1